MMKGFIGRCAGALMIMVIVSSLFGARVEAKPAKLVDLVDTVSANRIMTNFAAMIQASDLGTFLSSRGPFTLFVPTDSAFSRMAPGQLDALLQPQNQERLQHILLFHLVNGKRLYAKDLLTMHDLPSCEGNPLTVRQSRSGTQMVLKARIVHADIKCLNGVIHEIDTVLMPPESALPPLLPPPPTTNAAPAGETNAPSALPPAPAATAGTNAAPTGETNAPSALPPAPAATAGTNTAPAGETNAPSALPPAPAATAGTNAAPQAPPP